MIDYTTYQQWEKNLYESQWIRVKSGYYGAMELVLIQV